MSRHDKTNSIFKKANAPSMALVREFLSEQAAALVDAAERLGGPDFARDWIGFLNAMAAAREVTDRHLAVLIAMDRLLRVEVLDGSGSDPLALGASIEPSDAVVHQLCPLADSLRSLLETLAEGTASTNGPEFRSQSAA